MSLSPYRCGRRFVKTISLIYAVCVSLKPCLPVSDFMTSVQVYPKPELSVFSYLFEDSAAIAIMEVSCPPYQRRIHLFDYRFKR